MLAIIAHSAVPLVLYAEEEKGACIHSSRLQLIHSLNIYWIRSSGV